MASTDKKSKKPSNKANQGNNSIRLKTVIRKLPPNLPEEVFWQSVALWVNENTCTWKTFHKGKLKGSYVDRARGMLLSEAEMHVDGL